jgi:hypothetical protein
MQLPTSVLPILEAVSKSSSISGRVPLEIWRTEDHRLWIDAFLALGCALFASDIPEDGLPEGYLLTAYLFDWEAQCQFSGWSAFANRPDSIERVLEFYGRVGLADEADALRRARVAWSASGGDHDQTTAAYLEHRPRLGEQARLEHLVCHMIDNANDLFYARVEV